MLCVLGDCSACSCELASLHLLVALSCGGSRAVMAPADAVMLAWSKESRGGRTFTESLRPFLFVLYEASLLSVDDLLPLGIDAASATVRASEEFWREVVLAVKPDHLVSGCGVHRTDAPRTCPVRLPDFAVPHRGVGWFELCQGLGFCQHFDCNLVKVRGLHALAFPWNLCV